MQRPNPALGWLGIILAAGCGTSEREGPERAGPEPARDRTLDRFEDRAADLGLTTEAWSRADWDNPEDPYSLPCGRELYSSGGVVVADLTGDDRLDLFVPRLDGPDRLFVQTADGTFRDEAPTRGLASSDPSGGALAVDLTGDGRLDLYVTSPGRADHRLYVATDDGGFVEEAAERGVALPRRSEQACGGGFGAAAADIDGDGDLDLAVAAWLQSPRSAMFLNDGDGYFTDATVGWGLTETSSLAGFSPVLADLDGDGAVDLLYVGDFEDTRLYWNVGDRFEDGTEAAGLAEVQDGMGVDLADIDGDGDLDIFITAICERVGFDCEGPFGFNGNHLLVQTGARQFRDEAAARGVLDGGWGWGTAFWDVDEDGHPDLGMTNGYAFLEEYLTDAGVLWRNDGSGRFEDRTAAWGLIEAGQGRGYVPADLDGDGDLDLVVTDHDHGLRVFIRRGAPAAGRWLDVRLRAPSGPNRHGVGATVWARPTRSAADEPWQRRDILAFDRYQGHGPATAHFSFATPAEAVDVRIHWPDGAQTRHEGLPTGTVRLPR